MAKRNVEPKADRKRKLEELKRQQRAKERRKTFITVGIATLLGLGLIAAVVVPAVVKDQKLKSTRKADARAARLPLATYGVKAADAACSAEAVDNPLPKAGEHVPQGEHIDYPVAPPTGGKHTGDATLHIGTGFYARSDSAAAPEHAVHSLEHGVVIAWYDKTVSADDVTALRKIGASAVDKKLRFIAVPWQRTEFADNKHVVLTSWGHRQACGAVSGEAIEKFVTTHQDNKDAPEHGGAV